MKDKHIINISEIKENETRSVKKDKNTEYDIIDEQINILKMNGYKEIEQYKILVYDFVNNINKLSVFKKINEDILRNQIVFLCVDEFLNSFVLPIFEGENGKMPFIDSKTFNSMRKDMYNNLINKYINKIEDNLPF